MAPGSILATWLGQSRGSSSGYSGGSNGQVHVLRPAPPVSAKNCGEKLGEPDWVWGRSSVDGHTRDEEVTSLGKCRAVEQGTVVAY